MSSYQIFKNHSNQQVRYISSTYSTYTENKQRTCSTTQNCLFKILRTITTIPSEHDTIKVQSLSTSQIKDSEKGVKRTGFSIDLNVGFCVESNTNGFSSENSCGVVENCINNNECEVMEEEKLLESGGSLELSKFDNDGVSKNRKVEKLEVEEKGFMDLLIEAARLIFGEFKDDEDLDFEPEKEKKSVELIHNSGNRTKQLKRKNKNWGVEYVEENVERKCDLPVIKSKRGRIQVLPCKYRDSVIEPLTRFTRNRLSIVGNNRRQGSLRGIVR